MLQAWKGGGWCVVTQSTSLIANMAEGMDGGYGSLSISINADPQCAAGVNSPVKRIAPPRFNCSSFAAAAVRAAVPRTSPYATHNDVIFQVAGVSLLLHPLPSPLHVFIVPANERNVTTREYLVEPLLFDSFGPWLLSTVVVSRISLLITRCRNFFFPFCKDFFLPPLSAYLKLKVSFFLSENSFEDPSNIIISWRDEKRADSSSILSVSVGSKQVENAQLHVARQRYVTWPP